MKFAHSEKNENKKYKMGSPNEVNSMTELMRQRLAEINKDNEDNEVYDIKPSFRDGNDSKRKQYVKKIIAGKCVSFLADTLSIELTDFDLIIDPCHRNGEFVSALLDKNVDPTKLLYVDKESTDEKHRENFIASEVVPDEYHHHHGETKCMTVGFPVSGPLSTDAVLFFNKAAEFSDIIAFVVPVTFSDVYSCNRLNKDFFLAAEKKLTFEKFGIGDNLEVTIYTYGAVCSFQIWCHKDFTKNLRQQIDLPLDGVRPQMTTLCETPDFVFVDADSSPDFAIKRKGKFMGRLYTSPTHKFGTHYFNLIKDAVQLNGKSVTNVIFSGPSCEGAPEDEYTLTHKTHYMFIKVNDGVDIQKIWSSLLNILEKTTKHRTLNRHIVCQLHLENIQ